ncbi:TIGR02186 family protein [Rubellimicrobium arenae]|uniref:TIGR02186 family protein n=1 Tax=Rubellimicrobium arenae TaxID=2817372 RepID=UPI001B306DB0|nr:TIGR02186 family protein [Rubellimicrobium arenae]
MIRTWAALLALLLAVVAPARAEEIVLGLSSDEVAITATFDGSDILIFGAVKRAAPAPQPAPLQVIITVSGPQEPLTVREAERRLGIWVNSRAVRVDAAPTFYAVATTGPLDRILRDTEDLRHSISIPRAIRAIGNDVGNREDFLDALIRIREQEGSYQILEGGVDFEQETLFRTEIGLPANLTEGDYVTRIFLTRDGRIVDSYEASIYVRKVGLERWLFALAQEQPFLYGLMALAIAIAAGWGASAGFRALRG